MPRKATITLTIELPSDEKLAVLRAIPPRGMGFLKTTKLSSRSALMDLVENGLVRVDACGSVYLTMCGLLCIETIDELKEQEQNEQQTNGVAA